MSKKITILFRRASQTIFIFLFIYLIFYSEVFKITDTTEVLENFFFYSEPLIALSVFISSTPVSILFFTSLIFIVISLFAGRFFCGWFCPMGTILTFTDYLLTARPKINPQKIFKLKYIILLVTAISTFSGLSLFGFFEPISLSARSLGETVLPITYLLISKTLQFIVFVFSYLNIFNELSENLSHSKLFYYLTVKAHSGYFGASAIFLFFLGVLLLNIFYKRFWCHGICPLGALYAFFSRFSIWTIYIADKNCTGCGKCTNFCAVFESKNGSTVNLRTECLKCFSCFEKCPSDAILFGINKSNPNKINLSKREFITSATAGLITPYFLLQNSDNYGLYPERIRPPFAKNEKSFLELCLRCGECMRICPTHAIHPSISQAGLEGIFSPIIIPKIGYCEFECVECGKVCPTKAIGNFTLEKKKKFHLGTAFIDNSKCLPYAFSKNCVLCEEMCPTSPKAIIFEKNQKGFMVPRILPEHCIGCGICEYYCPVKGTPAITVKAVNETRNKDNSLLILS